MLTPSASYDRDFLLQFQSVCTGRPSAMPDIHPAWLQILHPTLRDRAHPPGSKGKAPTTPVPATETPTQVPAPSAPRAPTSKASEPAAGSVVTPPDSRSPAAPRAPSESGRSSSPTEVGGPDPDVKSPKYPSDRPLDELDEDMRDARLDVLEARLAALVAEATVVKLEVKRLKEAWRGA